MYVDNMLYTLDTWVTFCTYQIDSMKMNAVRSLSFSTYLPPSLYRVRSLFSFFMFESIPHDGTKVHRMGRSLECIYHCYLGNRVYVYIYLFSWQKCADHYQIALDVFTNQAHKNGNEW